MSSSKGAMPIRSRPPHRTMLTELAASGQITPPPSDTDDPAYVASAIEILTASEYGTVGDVKTVRFDLGHHDSLLGSLDARVETVAERLSDVANELDAVADEAKSSGRSTYSWENKFDHIDVRFSELEEKMVGLEEKVDMLEEKVDILEEKVDGLQEEVSALREDMEARLDRLEARFDRLESRLMNQNRYRLNDFVERGPFTKNGLNRVRDYWNLHRPENRLILVQELEARSIAWEVWAIPEHEDSGDLDPPPSTHLEAVSHYPVPAVMQLFGYLGLQYRKVQKEINRLEARKAKLERQSVLKQRSDMEVNTDTQGSSTDSPEQWPTASQ